MRLILHQAVKDLREQRWLAAAWLATLLAVGAVEALKLDVAVAAGDAVKDHPIPPALLLIALTYARSVLGWLLAARIVQADPVDDTGAFWRTRPISPGMLMKAKMALLAFLFFVVPGVVAVVVFLANDVAPASLLSCVVQWCLFNAVPLLPFILLSTLTRDRARIGLALIVGTIAWTSQLAVATLMFEDSRRLWGGWMWAYRAQALSLAGAGFLIVVLSLAFVVWQYRARPRPLYGWLSLGVVLAIAAASVQAHVRTNTTPPPPPPADYTWAGADAVKVSIPADSISASGPASAATSQFARRTVFLVGEAIITGVSDDVLIDLADGEDSLQLPDRDLTLRRNDVHWRGYNSASYLTLRTESGRRAFERALGARFVGPSRGPWNSLSLAWFAEADYGQYKGTRANLRADLTFVAYRVTLSPAAPLRPGASVGERTMGATVLSVGPPRVAPQCWEADMRETDARPFLPRTAVRLGYVLRNRRLKEALPLSSSSMNSVVAQGLASTFLTVTGGTFAIGCSDGRTSSWFGALPSIDKAWLADAELLMVTGEPLGMFKRHVVVPDFVVPDVK